MRIAFLAHFWIPHCRGGSELMGQALCESLAARGHHVDVFVTEQGDGSRKINGVNIHFGRASLARLRLGKYQVVISHHKEVPRAAGFSRQMGARLVTVLHNENAETRANMVHPAVLRVYNTEWLREALNGQGIVVHPPVYPVQHRTDRGGCITLVNLIPAKGSDLFYALARRMPDVQFLGVCGGYGKQRIECLPNVSIQPTTSDMRRDVWSKTRILLMPSDYESYGMAGVEAMASGIPVVAHPTLGLLESLGEAGIFRDRSDVAGWESDIRRLLADDSRESAAARDRSARIDTAEELEQFCNAVEAVCR